jgi:hypothetical protein
MKKLFIIFAVLCLAAPAMAADWNFYGSARMATFYSVVDKDIPGDNDTVNRLDWAQQGNSRIGATVKVNDQIGGAFEMSDSFGKRKLYGTYTFGGGSELLLGQTYTPLGSMFYSNSVFAGDGDLLGVGQFYDGRQAMVQWKTGGLKLAAIQANVPADGAGAVSDLDPNGVGYAVDLIIPKLEVNYKLKGDSFFMDMGAGYQTFGIDYFAGNDPTIQAYVLALGGGMNFGAFYVNLGGHYGQNLGNFTGSNAASLSGLPAIEQQAGIDDNQNEIDNTGYGALAVLGFNVSDMWSIEAGYGFEYGELDLDGDAGDGETVQQMYVNATINIAPGFFIVPEVGIADYDYVNGRYAGEGDPNPSVFYAGAKWQINF